MVVTSYIGVSNIHVNYIIAVKHLFFLCKFSHCHRLCRSFSRTVTLEAGTFISGTRNARLESWHEYLTWISSSTRWDQYEGAGPPPPVEWTRIPGTQGWTRMQGVSLALISATWSDVTLPRVLSCWGREAANETSNSTRGTQELFLGNGNLLHISQW